MRVRYIFIDEYGASTLVSVMTLIDGSKSYFLLMKPLQSWKIRTDRFVFRVWSKTADCAIINGWPHLKLEWKKSKWRQHRKYEGQDTYNMTGVKILVNHRMDANSPLKPEWRFFFRVNVLFTRITLWHRKYTTCGQREALCLKCDKY